MNSEINNKMTKRTNTFNLIKKCPFYDIDKQFIQFSNYIMTRNINAWIFHGRPHWKSDPAYLHFAQTISCELWNFEQTLQIMIINRFHFKCDQRILFDCMKVLWLRYVRLWNVWYQIDSDSATVGYMAIIFMYMVLPYYLLDNVGHYFTMYLANQINIVNFYHTNQNLPFVGIEELLDCEPFDAYAYKKWLDNKYCRAVWWVIYSTFERIHGYRPIINSDPAKLIQIC